MTDNGWVKLHRTILTDRKVRTLSIGRRWLFVACILAAQSRGKWRGYLLDDSGKPLSARQLGDLAGVHHTVAYRGQQQLVTLGLLSATSSGWLKVTNYNTYQGVAQIASDTDESVAQIASPVAEIATDVALVAKSVAKSVAEIATQARTPTPKNKKEEVQEQGTVVVASPVIAHYLEMVPIPINWQQERKTLLNLVEVHGEDEVEYALEYAQARDEAIPTHKLLRYITATLIGRKKERDEAEAELRKHDKNPYKVPPGTNQFIYDVDPAYPENGVIKIPLDRCKELGLLKQEQSA